MRGTIIRTQTVRQALVVCSGRDLYAVAKGLRMASTLAESEPGALTKDKSSGQKKERVVILGSGWAGYAFARTLDPHKFERIMISPRSYFVFTPLVAGTAVGTLEFRAVVESVRKLGLDRYLQGWADGVDFGRKVVRVEANTADELTASSTSVKTDTVLKKEKGAMFDVPYDKLVIAVGAHAQTFGTEGVAEHAHFLRDVGDARRIRTRVLECFERASLPDAAVPGGEAERDSLLHFAVVGGGPTGVEFAAELHDLVRDDLSKTYPDLVGRVRITVYDVAPKVLPMFDRNLASYAMDTFRREGIDVRTEHHLTRIRPDPDFSPGCLRLKFQEHGDEEIGAGLVVWSTGLMQNPLISRLGIREGEGEGAGKQLQKDGKTGGLLIDDRLRVTTTTTTTNNNSNTALDGEKKQQHEILRDVFSIGDCAVVDGQRYPATAQVASQQAAYLAKRLNAGNITDAAPPFRFRNWGVMTYLGGWRAIHQSSADELTGRAAWFLWRTAYLTKSMTVRNKIMVPVYWFMSWLFGRDISRF